MQKRSCFCGFWKRRVHSSAWQSGFHAAGCQFAGQLRHMECAVRTLSCRNSFEDRDRGIFVPLFCGVGFCDLLWVYLEKNTDAPNGAATRRSRLRRAAPAAATERCFLPLSKATTKRLRYARAGGSKLYPDRRACGCNPPSGGSDWAQQPKAASVQSVFFFQIRSKLNQSLPFLSPHKTNTIIREERADKKSHRSL